MEIFTTKDEVERRISLFLLAVPTILEYNITQGLSALYFDGTGLFNNIEQIHSTLCIPFHHIILGANTLRYSVPSAVTRIRIKDSWSDRNNFE